jgi:hypothetical protein
MKNDEPFRLMRTDEVDWKNRPMSWFEECSSEPLAEQAAGWGLAARMEVLVATTHNVAERGASFDEVFASGLTVNECDDPELAMAWLSGSRGSLDAVWAFARAAAHFGRRALDQDR